MKRRLFLASMLALGACAGGPQARAMAPGSTLVVLRHAEKDAEGLTGDGMARAQALVAALADTEIDAILTPNIARNGPTVRLLAEARGLVIEQRPHDPLGSVLAEGAGRSVLWVSRKNEIRDIWRGLGIEGDAPLDYGDVSILRTDAAGRLIIERRRFGLPD